VLQVTVPAAFAVLVLTPFVRVARKKSKIGTSPSITNLGCRQRWLAPSLERWLAPFSARWLTRIVATLDSDANFQNVFARRLSLPGKGGWHLFLRDSRHLYQ
jgi:hypothetical protein